jgi:hypothetical protein
MISLRYGATFLPEAFDRFLALPVFEALRPLEPRFEIVRTLDIRCAGISREDGGDGRPLVTLYDHPLLGRAEALQTVLHEMTHALGLWRHDRHFREALCVATVQAYPSAEATAEYRQAHRLRRRGAIADFDLALVHSIRTCGATS